MRLRVNKALVISLSIYFHLFFQLIKIKINVNQKIPTNMHHSIGLIPQPWKRGWLVSNGITLRGLEAGQEVVIGDDSHSTNVAVQW